jgi:hypothetical protein
MSVLSDPLGVFTLQMAEGWISETEDCVTTLKGPLGAGVLFVSGGRRAGGPQPGFGGAEFLRPLPALHRRRGPGRLDRLHAGRRLSHLLLPARHGRLPLALLVGHRRGDRPPHLLHVPPARRRPGGGRRGCDARLRAAVPFGTDALRPRTVRPPQAAGGLDSTGKLRSRQPWSPPARGRTRDIPRRLRRSATRALVASLGQVQ